MRKVAVLLRVLASTIISMVIILLQYQNNVGVIKTKVIPLQVEIIYHIFIDETLINQFVVTMLVLYVNGQRRKGYLSRSLCN